MAHLTPFPALAPYGHAISCIYSAACHCENSIPRGGMRVDRNLQDAERPPMNRAGYGTASDESD